MKLHSLSPASSFVSWLALVSCALAAVAPAQEPKPAAQPKEASAKPTVYDETADARQDLAAAVMRAKAANKRVLLQWGGNWCGWCVLLDEALRADRLLADELRAGYVVVHVDIGTGDAPKHRDLAKELGAALRSFPYLTILDSDGKPVVQQHTEPFETKVDGKSGHDPKKLREFFAKHAAKLDAVALRDAAFARAKAEGKRVFAHFGGPGCGWCVHLEKWLAQPEVAALVGKDFVVLKVDTGRMANGAQLHEQALATAGVKGGGIPWIVLSDADGKQLATGTGPQGNIGFPYKDDEVAHFVAMLETTRVKLTAADVETLRASLVAYRKADEERKQKPADR